jgi:DNA mismatch repair ATPase MutL
MKRLVQRAVSKALDAPQHFAKEDVAFAPVFSDFSFETVHNAPVEAASAPVYYQAYVASGEQQASFSFDEVQVVGIWGRKVIVDALSFSESSPIKMDAGLCIIDLEAARARITFENLLKSKDERIPGQALLFPISVQMSAVEIDALMQSQDILINMGYSFTQTSPRSILIDALPSSCTEGDAKDVLFEMAASCISLDRDEGEGLEGKKRRELAKIACRHQQGGDSAVTKAEALSIIKALMKTQAPYFCPEGKKTIAYVSEKDIEKYFFAAP